MNKYNGKFKRDLFTALVLLGMGLVIQFVIIPKTIRVAYNPLMTGSALVQNGRIIPSVCGVLIILSGIWLLLELYQNRKYYLDKEKGETFSLKQVIKDNIFSLVYVVITIAFVLIMPILGYLPSAILAMAALCWVYGYGNKIIVPCIVVLIPVVLYLVFTKVLYVSF